MKTTPINLNLPIAELRDLSVMYVDMLVGKVQLLDYSAEHYSEQIDQVERLSHDLIQIHRALLAAMAAESKNVVALVAPTPQA